MMIAQKEIVLRKVSFREALIAGFPISGNVAFTLRCSKISNLDTNRLFSVWDNLDAQICHHYLDLGNNWRKIWTRPKWIVAMEKSECGNKHLHGIVAYQNALDYKLAFERVCEKEKKWRLDSWTWQSDLITDDRGWINYMMKSASLNAYEQDRFDFRASRNCPAFRNLETLQ